MVGGREAAGKRLEKGSRIKSWDDDSFTMETKATLQRTCQFQGLLWENCAAKDKPCVLMCMSILETSV